MNINKLVILKNQICNTAFKLGLNGLTGLQ